jgi:predicted transcriptional regulator
MTTVILNGVKTAISLPDDLFRRADELARRLGIPRSQLYARALSEYLDARGPAQVTAALNTVYAESESALDAHIAAAQAAAVGEEDW